MLRAADFNAGSFDGFLVDSGLYTATGGALQVSAANTSSDAAAVWYTDQYLPTFYEVSASIKAVKPTGGWKANAYVIFDYFSPTDFKFAGVDVSTTRS